MILFAGVVQFCKSIDCIFEHLNLIFFNRNFYKYAKVKCYLLNAKWTKSRQFKFKIIILIKLFGLYVIGGFHVTSYQANFASHHTHNRHVGSLFACVVLGKATKCSVTFYLVYTIIYYKITTKWQEYQPTVTQMKFQIHPSCKLKVQAFVVVFSSYRAV